MSLQIQNLINAGWSEAGASFLISKGGLPLYLALRKTNQSPVPFEYRKKGRLKGFIRLAVFTRDGFRCRVCGSEFQLEVDHIVAEVNGGGQELSNLQTLCRSCNRRKGSR